MNRIATVLSFFLLPVLLAGCHRQPVAVAADPDLLAKVGGQEVRVSAFREAMEQRRTGSTPQEKEALLQELVERAALIQRAMDKGLDKDADVQRSVENLLIGKLRETEMNPPSAAAGPTEKQIQAAYEANLSAWQEPAMRRGALIFIPTPSRTSDSRKAELRSRIEAARQQALALPQDDPAIRGFGAVAVEYSEDQASRYQGGETGWIRESITDSHFDPAVVKALFAAARPGEVSDVLESSRGFHIFKLLEIRPARIKPLAEVRPSLQQKLRRELSGNAESAWKQQARNAVKIELFLESLDAIPVLPPAPSPPDAPPDFK